MSGSVFLETLRRHWRTMLYWAIGIAFMGVYIVLVIPDSQTLKKYAELIGSMPKFLIAAMGGTNAAAIGTPTGFLAYGFFGWIMLVFATYGVLAGLNITANEEDRGIMDILLSQPIPRWRIVVEKFLAYTVAIVVMVLISFITLAVSIGHSTTFQTDTGHLLEASLNMIPGTLLVMAFTAFVGTIIRRRSTAAAISAAFVALSYFVDIIGRNADITGGLRVVSYFNYYNPTDVMQHGLVLVNVIGLLIVAILLAAGTLWGFERRDIGV